MNLFPPLAGFGNSSSEDQPMTPDFRQAAKEPEKAQMTILYAGKVLVFDDFPIEKAKDVMLFVSKASSLDSSSLASTSGGFASSSLHSSSLASTSGGFASSFKCRSDLCQES
uniref:Protein TIFY n=1 Tax=Nelumbo nucifera TaxID=4432 RepID=A0A822YNN5_NELNU|nr:TPA_asm: hypothetical protein HUJ06_006434 [Nelumbo nucifera]